MNYYYCHDDERCRKWKVKRHHIALSTAYPPHTHSKDSFWTNGPAMELVTQLRTNVLKELYFSCFGVENLPPFWEFVKIFFYACNTSNLLKFYSVTKISDLFFCFAKFEWISIKPACMRRRWTFIRLHEFFSRLPIASVDGKQHLSELVFSVLVRFTL